MCEYLGRIAIVDELLVKLEMLLQVCSSFRPHSQQNKIHHFGQPQKVFPIRLEVPPKLAKRSICVFV
jgi:hypothetical protein